MRNKADHTPNKFSVSEVKKRDKRIRVFHVPPCPAGLES